MGTIPRLNLRNANDLGSLNRWADAVAVEFTDTKSQVAATNKQVQAAPLTVFGPSGPNHSTGIVPDPGSVAGTSKFLREDATWQSAGGGDGLVHGDSIWEVDSAWNGWREDFLSAGRTLSGFTNPIGELGWGLGGSSGITPIAIGGTPPHLGQLVWSNNGTAGTSTSGAASFVTLGGAIPASPDGLALFDNPGWKMVFVWRWTGSAGNHVAADFTKKSIYIGVCASEDLSFGASLGRPLIFYGLRYDTDTSIADTTLKFEGVQNTIATTGAYQRNDTQGTVIDTGLTPKANVWYRLELTYATAGTISLSLYASNGTSKTNQSFTVPTYIYNNSTTGSVVNGLGIIQANTAPNQLPWATGSSVTVSGYTGGISSLNSVWTLDQNPSASSIPITITFWTGLGAISSSTQTAKLSGYPAMGPIVQIANDTEASPTVSGLFTFLDFWALAWNSGLAASPKTLSSGNSRWTQGS